MIWLSDFLRETTTMTHSYTMSASHPFAGRFFLCHQKIAAGSMARLLKIELQKRGSKFTTFATWTISRWFRGTSLARFWGENVERGGLNMSKLRRLRGSNMDRNSQDHRTQFPEDVQGEHVNTTLLVSWGCNMNADMMCIWQIKRLLVMGGTWRSPI